jgi:two-component sensor histidine kinase
LAHYGIGREGRVAVEGPPVQLKPRAAIAIGMALHELTANAARYGALSVPQGRVHLSWAIEGEDGADRRLVIRWRESDGPKLSQPENTRYGRTLIENGLAEQIGASGSIAFAEDGLRSELSLPLGSGLVLPSDADAD